MLKLLAGFDQQTTIHSHFSEQKLIFFCLIWVISQGMIDKW